ncbi:MAG: pyrroline-5-carboxylate reductase [Candidatus Omnitrophota bacterium]
MKIGIIGAGNMGEAIIRGLVKKKGTVVWVCENNKKRQDEICRAYRVKKITLEQFKNMCNIIILCVKPQNMDEVLCSLSFGVNKKNLLISIAAGVTTSHIQKFFKSKVPVVRVMPNMPGMIGQGISAYCLGKYVRAKDEKNTKAIFSNLGETLKTTENKMNAITAVSGSGPGFQAYFMAGLEEAASAVGLTKQEARLLSISASAGSANMVSLEGSDPSKMVERVASKGGTTEAGLNELIKGKFKRIIKNAIKSAVKRAKELSKD